MASGKTIIFSAVIGAVITGACGIFATLWNGHLDRQTSNIQALSSDVASTTASITPPNNKTNWATNMPTDTDKLAQSPTTTTDIEVSVERSEISPSPLTVEVEDRDGARLCNSMYKVDIQKSGFSTSGVVVLSSGSDRRYRLTLTSEWVEITTSCNIRLIETGRNPNYFAKIEVLHED